MSEKTLEELEEQQMRLSRSLDKLYADRAPYLKASTDPTTPYRAQVHALDRIREMEAPINQLHRLLSEINLEIRRRQE